MIAIGERVPNTIFQVMTELGPTNVTAQEIFGGKSVMLFGVPGAFTPSCHYLHVPGYLDELETFRRQRFVLARRGRNAGGRGQVGSRHTCGSVASLARHAELCGG